MNDQLTTPFISRDDFPVRRRAAGTPAAARRREMAAPAVCLVLLLLPGSLQGQDYSGLPPAIYHAQGEMAGEPTADSVLLQSRLTAVKGLTPDDDVPGKAGVARFIFSEQADLAARETTPWLRATEENDYIVRRRLQNLRPGTVYYYRLEYGIDEQRLQQGPVRRFRTLPGESSRAAVSFLMFNCMNWSAYMYGWRIHPPYQGPDKQQGYPALAQMQSYQDAYFVIGAGDLVYYDVPVVTRARALPQMRAKWQQQFSFPRWASLLGAMGCYWMKDDHDFRFNDSDPVSPLESEAKLPGGNVPSAELGIKTFKEQMPVVPWEDFERPTYRTVRASRQLQLWFLEGRDYRSPNGLAPGPEKSIWGAKQKEWLQRTLSASDAHWKLIISPSPMVGPDYAGKNDNHANDGFRHEGEEFFAWLKRNDVKNVAILCGDRHWQYHSIHPSGISEFACGPLNGENAYESPPRPGEQGSSDPKGLIRQPFLYPKATGGFLHVRVDERAALKIDFVNEKGEVLYAFDSVN